MPKVFISTTKRTTLWGHHNFRMSPLVWLGGDLGPRGRSSTERVDETRPTEGAYAQGHHDPQEVTDDETGES